MCSTTPPALTCLMCVTSGVMYCVLPASFPRTESATGSDAAAAGGNRDRCDSERHPADVAHLLSPRMRSGLHLLQNLTKGKKAEVHCVTVGHLSSVICHYHANVLPSCVPLSYVSLPLSLSLSCSSSCPCPFPAPFCIRMRFSLSLVLWSRDVLCGGLNPRSVKKPREQSVRLFAI